MSVNSDSRSLIHTYTYIHVHVHVKEAHAVAQYHWYETREEYSKARGNFLAPELR